MNPIFISGKQRFDGLLKGRSALECDQVLMQSGDWVVAPTAGSIVPGWLLAIPRTSALNLKSIGGSAAHEVLGAVQARLGLGSGELIWFEHGPAVENSLVGCGLDYAHLHILVRPEFSFAEFKSTAFGLSELDWEDRPSAEAYAQLDSASSYLVAGSGNEAIRAVNVEDSGSQFFRRVVASVAGVDGWNYRTHMHGLNVSATIEQFRELERATAT